MTTFDPAFELAWKKYEQLFLNDPDIEPIRPNKELAKTYICNKVGRESGKFPLINKSIRTGLRKIAYAPMDLQARIIQEGSVKFLESELGFPGYLELDVAYIMTQRTKKTYALGPKAEEKRRKREEIPRRLNHTNT